MILFFALAAVAPKRKRSGLDLKTPVGIVELALIFTIATWFIAKSSEWMPDTCILTIILLLASEKSGRRSMSQNLIRIQSAAWIAALGLALYWSWREQSFGGILIVVVACVLWFGNLLMHLSSGERPLALPHPQS